eukprot:tig00020516_g9956.t2
MARSIRGSSNPGTLAHLSLGISTRDARAAGVSGTQRPRRPISRLGRRGRFAPAAHVSLARLAAPSRWGRPGSSGGPSIAWRPDSRGSAAAHLSLGRTSRGARAATAAGAQRRFISRLATRLAEHSRQGRGGRDAAAAHLSPGAPNRCAFAAGQPGRSGGSSLASELDSQRPCGGGGRNTSAAHFSLRDPTRGAFAAGPGRPEDSK